MLANDTKNCKKIFFCKNCGILGISARCPIFSRTVTYACSGQGASITLPCVVSRPWQIMLMFWPIFLFFYAHFLLFLSIFLLNPPIFLKTYAWYAKIPIVLLIAVDSLRYLGYSPCLRCSLWSDTCPFLFPCLLLPAHSSQ